MQKYPYLADVADNANETSASRIGVRPSPSSSSVPGWAG